MIHWFEIPVLDFYRAKRFYEYVFQIEIPVSDMGAYTMGFFPAKGEVAGAIVQGDGYQPSVYGARIYLTCNPDLSAFVERAVQMGGQVIVPKFLITEEVGYCAFVLDSEGNSIAMHSVS